MNRDIPRVLLVGPAMNGGGAEGRFRRLAARLFNGSTDVAVLVSAGTVSREFGARLLDLRWTGALSYPRIALKLARRMRDRRYVAVMAFGLFPGLVVALARPFAPLGSLYVYSEVTRPLEALKGTRGWRRHAYKWLWELTARRFDVLTANSLDGLDEIRSLSGRAAQPGYRLHNLIDSSEIRRLAESPVELTVSGKYLLWYGRLDAMKRVDCVVRAFASVCFKFAPVKLVILGDGELRDEMRALVVALGISDSVVFLPSCENPFPILVRARGMVLASELEGFSNSVIEAMFLDVPVITSYCSSDAHAMCAAGAALGFEIGDVDELSRQMCVVLERDDVRTRLIDGARAYRAPHEQGASLAHYESVLQKLVE